LDRGAEYNPKFDKEREVLLEILVLQIVNKQSGVKSIRSEASQYYGLDDV